MIETGQFIVNCPILFPEDYQMSGLNLLITISCVVSLCLIIYYRTRLGLILFPVISVILLLTDIAPEIVKSIMVVIITLLLVWIHVNKVLHNQLLEEAAQSNNTLIGENSALKSQLLHKGMETKMLTETVKNIDQSKRYDSLLTELEHGHGVSDGD